MMQIAVSLGSNIDRERNIRAAAQAIRSSYPKAVFSPVFRSAAVGFDGPDFLNLVALYDSDRLISEVLNELHEWEDGLGRERRSSEWTSRTIDLDLLLYGDGVFYDDGIDVPRKEILKYAHVLKPLSLILPTAVHPLTGQTYAELWAQMSDEQDALLAEETLSL